MRNTTEVGVPQGHSLATRRREVDDGPAQHRVAMAVARRSAIDRVWLLVVPRCPLCSGKHVHGGGSDALPHTGTRAAHCGRGGYLVAIQKVES